MYNFFFFHPLAAPRKIATGSVIEVPSVDAHRFAPPGVRPHPSVATSPRSLGHGNQIPHISDREALCASARSPCSLPASSDIFSFPFFLVLLQHFDNIVSPYHAPVSFPRAPGASMPNLTQRKAVTRNDGVTQVLGVSSAAPKKWSLGTVYGLSQVASTVQSTGWTRCCGLPACALTES